MGEGMVREWVSGRVGEGMVREWLREWEGRDPLCPSSVPSSPVPSQRQHTARRNHDDPFPCVAMAVPWRCHSDIVTLI